MLKPLTEGPPAVRLGDLGAVRVLGPDAVRFLQGQVSSDVSKLTPATSMLAGVHTPQGRVIAVLRLIAAGPDEVLGVLPRELAAVVATRLAKFVLRAKAKVSDASAEWELSGVSQAGSAEAGFPTEMNAAQRLEDGRIVVCVGASPARWLVATPLAAGHHAQTSPTAGTQEAAAREQWRALDIAAGIPQVYVSTSEAFVSQMLNLDVLGAIAFDKGCYTGQEVIARAHYRGRVKRRMQRFHSADAALPAPGTTGQFIDGRTFRVVEAVRSPDGGHELLAVTQTSVGHDASEPASSEHAPQAPIAATPIAAEQLALPYDLPQ